MDKDPPAGGEGFGATLQFDGLTDAETMAAAAADGVRAGNGRQGKDPSPRRRKKKMVEQPQYRMDDLEFLQQLMHEDVVKESDVKDIVGDGIRFLSELSTEAEAEAVANASPKRSSAAARNKRMQKNRASPPGQRDMTYTGERAGAADPERGIGQFLEAKLARDPLVKLKVRRQKRLGLRKPGEGGAGGGPVGGGARYDRTASVLARARAFVGEDEDEDASYGGTPSPQRGGARQRPLGVGISSRLYPAGGGDTSGGGDGAVRPLSLPALHAREDDDSPGGAILSFFRSFCHFVPSRFRSFCHFCPSFSLRR